MQEPANRRPHDRDVALESFILDLRENFVAGGKKGVEILLDWSVGDFVFEPIRLAWDVGHVRLFPLRS